MHNDSTERRELATIVFTDIVGSTELKHRLGEREAVALIKRHHALIRDILSGFPEGEEIETAGDSFFILFAKPSDAVQFALRVQSKLRALAPAAHPISDRIGIHVGEVLVESATDAPTDKAPSGIHVDTCARVMSLGESDQILLTRFAFDTARSVLKGEALEGLGPLCWMNHGPYRLKGVEESLEICEVGEAGKGRLAAPPDTEKAHRQISADDEPVLGWRPALEQVVPNTKWVLEKKLGEGGFGEVWLGRHQTLKERRVFKFCFRADRVRSLKREVTLFRLLKERVGQHPNIVGVQEVYFDAPPFYIVMDYAEGQDLKTWSEERGGVASVPLDLKLEIVAQVADALQAAHEAGVIHRDVKPSNILIAECGVRNAESETGKAATQFRSPSNLSSSSTPAHSEFRTPHLQVRLTDFGIGQVVSQEALAGLTRMGFTQTMLSPGSSSQTGTHLYMAPELIAGERASIRSDIYSLGVVLYQLLIGDLARPLTTDWAKRITDPLLREDLEKCFAGNPEERFSSAGQLAKNLRCLAERRRESSARQNAASRRRIVRTMASTTLAVAAVAALVFYAFTLILREDGKSIVVIPFTNDSPDKADEYLNDTLTDEMINRLKKVRGLKVARVDSSATNQLEDTRMLLAQFVPTSTMLEGSVGQSGETLHVRARLRGTANGRQLWSQEYHREIKGALTLPGELAQQVATALSVRLDLAERRQLEQKPTTNSAAYLDYLRGRFHVRHPGPASVANAAAIQTLERVVALDTNFAAAYAELGRAYVHRLFFMNPEEKQWESKAKAAVERAINLEPSSAEAHAARGYFLWTHGQGFPHEQAIEELKLALKLDPQLEEAYQRLLPIYAHVGLLDEAIELIEQARMTNPLEDDWRLYRAMALLWQGEYAEALTVYDGLRNAPVSGAPFTGSLIAWAQFQLGRTNDAWSTIHKYLAARPEDIGGLFAGVQAMLFAQAGEQRRAEEQITNATAHSKGFGHFHHTAYNMASAYALMDKPQQAIYWFKEAVDNGFNCYPLFLEDENLKSLRSDKAFTEILAKEEKKYKKIKAKYGGRKGLVRRQRRENQSAANAETHR
ncbi:MAG: protein kinase [Verrucomicrobia bacterium]|nr:protein kinase [Verrucomicrobiota bacterium]